jgi:hypothetical protein
MHACSINRATDSIACTVLFRHVCTSPFDLDRTCICMQASTSFSVTAPISWFSGTSCSSLASSSSTSTRFNNTIIISSGLLCGYEERITSYRHVGGVGMVMLIDYIQTGLYGVISNTAYEFDEVNFPLTEVNRADSDTIVTNQHADRNDESMKITRTN